jgi:hypothetical protein
VPAFSEEHALVSAINVIRRNGFLGDFSVTSPVADSKEQQLDYIDNLRALDRRDTEVHRNVFVAVKQVEASNRLPDGHDGKSERSID